MRQIDGDPQNIGWVSMREPEITNSSGQFEWHPFEYDNLLEIHLQEVERLLRHIGIPCKVELRRFPHKQEKDAPQISGIGEVATATARATKKRRKHVDLQKISVDIEQQKIFLSIDFEALSEKVKQTHHIEVNDPTFSQLYAAEVNLLMKNIFHQMVAKYFNAVLHTEKILEFQYQIARLTWLPTISIAMYMYAHDRIQHSELEKFSFADLSLSLIALHAIWYMVNVLSTFSVSQIIDKDQQTPELLQNAIYPKKLFDGYVFPMLTGQLESQVPSQTPHSRQEKRLGIWYNFPSQATGVV